MTEAAPLPRFERPPVTEVAAGVYFNPSAFSPLLYGAMRDRLCADFPTTQQLPPHLPLIEQSIGNPIQTQADLTSVLLLPRMLFISGDNCSLVQLQADRVFFNWRRSVEADTYPHFPFITKGFRTALKAFGDALGAIGRENATYRSCEVLYSNLLHEDDIGIGCNHPERAIRPWSGELGQEWQASITDLSFNARFSVHDDSAQEVGTLDAIFSTVQGLENQRSMRLEMVARMPVDSQITTRIHELHEVGHQAIVRCFAAITTPQLHDHWGYIK